MFNFARLLDPSTESSFGSLVYFVFQGSVSLCLLHFFINWLFSVLNDIFNRPGR